MFASLHFVRNIAISVSVRLSVRSLIPKTTCLNLTRFAAVHVNYDPVLL